jgi:SAM-dependent methyltransferase
MHTPASLPPVHIALIQPLGHLPALGLVDPARYLRHQLRRFGTEVTLAKNRLRADALNIVLGAHLGFAPDWAQRHACVFFNLEQLGDGGATLDADYLALLRRSAVADYDNANVAAYLGADGDAADVPVVPLLHAPYLERADTLPLRQRPIDLLFFGTMNDRRRAFLDRVEACGLQVATFDHPVYGEERDAYVRQAKAVLNCHYYASSRFEQARVSHCLSLGTPVIAERRGAGAPHPAFDDAVFWLDDGPGFERFFRERFGTEAFFADASARLARWRTHDPVDAYAGLMAFGAGVFQVHAQRQGSDPWRPALVNLGSGKDYKPGWLNVDVLDRAEPDVVLDLGQPVAWPVRAPLRFGGEVVLEPGSVQALYANNVLEHVPDLPTLMGNALELLAEGGLFEIEVPYERALTAWQDPTHVRALNEKSWLYYTEWFWYLGWFEHRFEITAASWLDGQLRDCAQDGAEFMRVTLKKVATSAHERTVARAMRPDFGGLPDDLPADTTPDVKPDETSPSAPDAIAAAASAPGTLLVLDEPAALASAAAGGSAIAATSLPGAAQVLEVATGGASLESAWRAAHGDAVTASRWTRAAPNALPEAGPFDLIVLPGLLDALPPGSPDAAALLAALRRLATPTASLHLAADNQATWNALEALLEGDQAEGPQPRRHTVATLTRTLLDAGWLPQVAAHEDTPHAPAAAFAGPALALAAAHQVPRATLQRTLSVDRFTVHAVPATDPVPSHPSRADAAFSVVVPTTRDGQLRRNVLASPGLAEVQAGIVACRGAASPADALAQALEHCTADWVLIAHQDVYFPRGFGHRLNALLAEVAPQDRPRTLIGFAGVGIDREGGRTVPAGLVIDRTSRFDHPASDAAMSIDELAVVVSRDTLLRIDPALGWHLWATDLCLQAIEQHKVFARIVRVPLFHHSSNDYTLGEAFHRSAAVLAAKHAGFGPIVTLCGTIDAPAAVAAA